jgi:crossover junction endodeoxyribonuclease RuvC
MIVVGIDPGNLGAIAILDKNDGDVVYDMPTFVTTGSGKTKKGNTKKHTMLDENEIRKILSRPCIDHVFIEKSQSMPGQGSSSTFNYACSYGIIRGICVGLELPYTLIHPATWKRSMMKDMDKSKDASIIRAKQLFPKVDIGKKDGRAEALLIAVYGKKEFL